MTIVYNISTRERDTLRRCRTRSPSERVKSLELVEKHDQIKSFVTCSSCIALRRQRRRDQLIALGTRARSTRGVGWGFALLARLGEIYERDHSSADN